MQITHKQANCKKIINYAQKGYGLSGVATLIGTADIAVGIFLSRDTSFIQSCFHSGLALLSTPISMACGIYASTELEKIVVAARRLANLYGLQDIEALKELEQCAHKYKYLRTAQGITDSLSIAVATGLSWSVYAEDKSLASDGYNLASSQLNDIPLDHYTRPERWVDTVTDGHSNYVVSGLLTTNAVAAAVRLALTHRKLSCRAEFGRILETFSNKVFEKWREQYREERPGPDPTEQISDKTKPATCAIDIGDVSDDGYHSDTTSGSTWATRFWSGGQNSTTTEASSGYGSDSSDNSDVVSTV